jgi:formylglycine-generating enzyme required for sulfatase activity
MWLLPSALLVLACDSSDDPDPNTVPASDAGTDTSNSTDSSVDAAETSDPPAEAGDQDATTEAGTVPAGFVRVDPGTFQRGSPPDEPGRSSDMEHLHEVVLTRSWIVKTTEVTQAEWETLMGANPSFFPECGADCPVDYVTFYDTLVWCNALSEQEGLPACYELVDCEGEPGIDMVCESVTVNAEGGNPVLCAGYRLPTEAEWEYSARAQTTTAFATGGFAPGEAADTCEQVAALAGTGWYCGNSEDMPHPAGTKQPNAWGLYDMAGNALEWVWDRYAAYPQGPVTDPIGDSSGPLRVLRGGSWSRTPAGCRSAAREALDPVERDGDTGFRPVRTMLP